MNKTRNRKNPVEQQQQQQQQQSGPRSAHKKSEDEVQELSNVHVLILFILFLLIVFFYTGLRVYLRPTKPPLPLPPVNVFQEYVAEIQQVKSMYFTQTDEFWDVLKVNAKHVLDGKDHGTPAVMMVAVPAGEKQLASCLVDYWNQIIHRLLGSQILDSRLDPIVDGGSVATHSPLQQRLMVSEQIQNLMANGYKSIVVNGWEKLHAATLQFLCTLCESTKPQYVQVSVIFLLEAPSASVEHQLNNVSDVHSYLLSIWMHFPEDQAKNFQAVIAANVAFLTPDDTFMGC